MRIQKHIANHSAYSRRCVERYILEQRVRVNGATATLGQKVTTEDVIEVDGKLLEVEAVQPAVLLFNKPVKTLCSSAEADHSASSRQRVFDFFPKSPGRWLLVGRLDYLTSGLLLVTNHGQLAHKLMHPSSDLAREYQVKCDHELSPQQLKKLLTGCRLADGQGHFDRCHKVGKNTYQVIVHQGRNRFVRRMFAAVNAPVKALKRVRFAEFWLPENLPSGHCQALSSTGVKRLMKEHLCG